MKTQIKQLVYGILATSCFGLSCTSLTWAAGEYQWPPKDGEPVVTLVGPVYETGSETKAPLFKALEQAMTTIVENQQTHLPEFYQQRIAGMNHQLFRPGYSNEEEWGSIKSLSSKAEDYDTERMAGILESSENRKPGLEMAIRMQPTIDPQPASVMLEGYRFILQPGGKGQAEWFTQEVRLSGREAGEEFRNALVWLLAKPFAQAQKSFVLENEEVPVWKDKNTAGTLKFADKKFAADAEPVRKEILDICVQTGRCPVMKVDGTAFALVSNFADAQAICRMFERVVIDENTLLRLSLNKKARTLLAAWSDDGKGSAWHSGGQTGYFKERSDHQEFVQAKTTGAVWCKLAKQETSTFVPETYIWSDGRKYVGEFKDDKPNGQGTLTYPDGRKYEVEWELKDGNFVGTLAYPDGKNYVGEFFERFDEFTDLRNIAIRKKQKKINSELKSKRLGIIGVGLIRGFYTTGSFYLLGLFFVTPEEQCTKQRPDGEGYGSYDYVDEGCLKDAKKFRSEYYNFGHYLGMGVIAFHVVGAFIEYPVSNEISFNYDGDKILLSYEKRF